MKGLRIRPATAGRRFAAGLALAVGSGLLAAGCAGGPPPGEPRPADSAPPAEPERVSPAPPEPAPEPPPVPQPPTQPSQGAERAVEEDGLTVVIDPGEEGSSRPGSLVEASRAERQRRGKPGPASIVITNDNLDEFDQGQVTEAGVVTGAPVAGGDEPAADDALRHEEESYWRQAALTARLTWRTALDDIERLEGRTAELRRRFYAEDDPYYRDSQIKPEWDRALDLLAQAREQAQRSRVEVQELLERGRRAGALPGWLREGIDLEPEPEGPRQDESEEDDLYYEPEDPIEVEEDDGGGRG